MTDGDPLNTPSTMRSRVDAYDWDCSPLGPRAQWPAELETVVQQVLDSRFPKAVTWGREFITIYNDAFRPILGDKPEALGRPFGEVWAEVWDQIGPIAQSAMEGQSTFIENFPLVIDRRGTPEQAYFTFCYSPLRLRDGNVAGMLDTVIETTETVETQRKLDIANHELAHRIKNSLAIVQSIASQTLRPHVDPDVLTNFERRLGALANAHGALANQDWSGGSMDALVRSALEAALDLSRVRISGEDVTIGSKTTMSLALLLHELATNALKYGAMSVDGGQVHVAWACDDTHLRFSWHEKDGPPVTAPEHKGFGSRLIRRGLSLAGKCDLDFDPDGLRVEASAPLDDIRH